MNERGRDSNHQVLWQLLVSVGALYLVGFGVLWADVQVAETFYVQRLPTPIFQSLDTLYGWCLDLEQTYPFFCGYAVF